MYLLLQYTLDALFIGTLILSVYFSYRYHRQTATKLRGIFAAKMNISMGSMLISLSAIQMFLFTGYFLRLLFGTVFLLLGLFNLFSGIRNYMDYSRS